MQGDSQATGLIVPRSSSINGSPTSDEEERSPPVPPVTPGVHTSGRSAYIQTDLENNTQLPFDSGNVSPGPQWSSNSYFVPRDKAPLLSPSDVASESNGGPQLPQRLRTAGDSNMKQDLSDIDPRAAHPNLNLSGHIISATFVVPYSLGFAPDTVWVRPNSMLKYI
jgi:trehalose 6-phosphate synthase/phosphatase